MYHAAGEQSDPLILDVIVVGAGQAGLATGVLSAAGGCSVLVVRCRRSHRRLVAPSLRFSCALQPSVLQRAAWHGDEGDPEGYPDRDEIAHYLEQYADSFRLPVVLQEGIGRLERDVAITSSGARLEGVTSPAGRLSPPARSSAAWFRRMPRFSHPA
jgi:hypothetical protein